MNKTLPDIFKDTEDLKTSRGLEWAPWKYFGIHCCKYLNRKQIKFRNFRKLKKLVLIYGVFHMQNSPRYMGVGGEGTSQPTALPHVPPSPHTSQALSKAKGLAKKVVCHKSQCLKRYGTGRDSRGPRVRLRPSQAQLPQMSSSERICVRGYVSFRKTRQPCWLLPSQILSNRCRLTLCLSTRAILYRTLQLSDSKGKAVR